MSYTFEGFAQQGWQCPVCKRVYSPMTTMCLYCGNSTITTSTSTTGTEATRHCKTCEYYTEGAKNDTGYCSHLKIQNPPYWYCYDWWCACK